MAFVISFCFLLHKPKERNDFQSLKSTITQQFKGKSGKTENLL